MKYAQQLSDKISKYNANAWLLNTGWVGASAARGGKRCSLKYTRAILDAIHSGELSKANYESFPTFNLNVPTSCPGVPSEILNPTKAWTEGVDSFNKEVSNLAGKFAENFKKYSDQATTEVQAAGPDV
jgi:phosphoenolpyruvate carboxykinase (ATP)